MIYVVPNYNPSLGPIKDGKQAVSVYDRDLGNRRTIITSQEEADAFVQTRKEVMQKAGKKGLVAALGTIVTGVLIGGLFAISRGKIADLKALKEGGKIIKNTAQLITPAVKEAATMGGLIGAIIGACIPAAKADNADKRITKAFIENSKFNV